MHAMNNNEALDSYSTELKSILDGYNLHGKPEKIYNVDKTGMPLDHWAPCILAKKGLRKVLHATSGNKY